MMAQEIMIERIIQDMIPSLRIALGNVLAGNSAHVFTCAEGVNSETGVKSKLSCFITHQHTCIFIEGVMKAAMDAEKVLVQQIQAAQEPMVKM